jgi:hypothetical protein
MIWSFNMKALLLVTAAMILAATAFLLVPPPKAANAQGAMTCAKQEGTGPLAMTRCANAEAACYITKAGIGCVKLP